MTSEIGRFISAPPSIQPLASFIRGSQPVQGRRVAKCHNVNNYQQLLVRATLESSGTFQILYTSLFSFKFRTTGRRKWPENISSYTWPIQNLHIWKLATLLFAAHYLRTEAAFNSCFSSHRLDLITKNISQNFCLRLIRIGRKGVINCEACCQLSFVDSIKKKLSKLQTYITVESLQTIFETVKRVTTVWN